MLVDGVGECAIERLSVAKFSMIDYSGGDAVLPGVLKPDGLRVVRHHTGERCLD